MDLERTRQNSVDQEDEPNKTYKWIGQRHVLSLLLFFCLIIHFLQRVNMSVALVAMTTRDNSPDNENAQNEDTEIFDWDNSTRSTILSSFFWGYLIMNLPGAVLGRYFNNKYLLAFSVTVGSCLACLTPIISSKAGWKGLAGLRLVQGLFQAFMMPTTHGIMSKWAPPAERGRLVGFILSGIQFGTMIILVTSGLLASTPWGWPSIFYITGLLGLIWVVLWLLFGDECPSSSKLISQEELKYITKQIEFQRGSEEKFKTPWRDIFTSVHVWAVVLAHACHNWGFYLLLTEMPQFFASVLHFNIKADGFLSALPYLGMWLMTFPVSFIADKMIQKNVASITTTRKIWNSIGMWGSCIGLIGLGYLDRWAVTAVATYVFIVSIGCCVNVGFNVNHMDLSPNFSGILMGVTNTLGAAGGLLAPLSVGYIVNDMTSISQWKMAFFSGAGILFFGNLFFIIFASGKLQPWNSPERTKKPSDTNGQESTYPSEYVNHGK